MQPPLSNGTVLQNRYHIQSVLGQGGFGRTYLAQDQGRFEENCVIKEFMPNSSSPYALEKSRELFQREAQILYQIQHSQVPQFRAVFEEEDRLFLMQDYIEGQTYRELLDQRQQTGELFTEAEVASLIQQLIPVLRHIHSKGIIHRDITPDNIILRQRDRLPVLIDFGVVKEIVTRVQMPEKTTPTTTVGKPGYAPSEQVQTGRAYPSSDLYALAVTALVLLSGQEPQDLFDDVILTWNWQDIPASASFMPILARMLSYRPSDRYQSVDELSQALQSMPLMTTASPSTALTPPPTQAPQPLRPQPPRPQPPASQMRTVAVGRPNPTTVAQGSAQPQSPTSPTASPTRQHTVQAPPPREKSVWDNLWSMLAIAAALAVVTAVGAFAIVNAIFNSPERSPVVETDQPDIETPPDTPSGPVEYSQPLGLDLGEPRVVKGSLLQNETINYVVSAERGQTLSANLDQEGVLMTVLGANERPVEGRRSRRVQSWSGELKSSEDYVIQLAPVEGIETSDYSLTVELVGAPRSRPRPTPEPEPEPEPEPTPEPEPGPNLSPNPHLRRSRNLSLRPNPHLRPNRNLSPSPNRNQSQRSYLKTYSSPSTQREPSCLGERPPVRFSGIACGRRRIRFSRLKFSGGKWPLQYAALTALSSGVLAA